MQLSVLNSYVKNRFIKAISLGIEQIEYRGLSPKFGGVTLDIVFVNMIKGLAVFVVGTVGSFVVRKYSS